MSLCVTDVDECLEQADTTLCLNQGTCVNDYGDYHCDCTIEWTGKICQTSTYTTRSSWYIEDLTRVVISYEIYGTSL